MKKTIMSILALGLTINMVRAQNTFPTPSGSVGIGTTTPSTMLHVTGGGTAYGNILTTVTPSLYANGGASGLGYGLISNTSFGNNGAWSNIGLVQQNSNANDLAAGVHLSIHGWYQNSGTSLPISLGGGYAGINPALYVASGDVYGNANIGIGTVTPNVRLQVNSANTGTGYADWVSANFGGQTGNRVLVGLLNGVATIGAHNNGLTDWSDLAINPEGTANVGIGTSHPGAKLDVMGNGSFSTSLSLGLGIAATNVFQLGLSSNYFGVSGVSFAGQFRWYTSPNNSLYKDNALYQLRAWDAGSNTENNIATFTGGGMLGVGTTSPQLKFHSDGASGFPANSGTAQTGVMRLGVAGGYGSVLDFGSNGPVGQGWIQSTDRSNLALNYFLLLNPNGGNVGVGTTNPGAALSVTNSSPVMELFDKEFNPGDGSSIGKIAFGSSQEWAAIEGMRYNGMADDVTYLKFSTSFAPGAGGDGIRLERMRLDAAGNLAIGTTDPKGYKLAVNGNAIAEQMTVKLHANWPDYVFKREYVPMPLPELKNYIDNNHHLPDVPSAAQVEKDGLNLGEINKVLVKKVEELTLYLIEQEKLGQERDKKTKEQEARLLKLERELELLKKQ